MLFTTTNFIAWTDIFSVPLFCGTLAGLSAAAGVGLLRYSRLERHPASIAEQGVPFSETDGYLICIGDECTAKSEYVRRAG